MKNINHRRGSWISSQGFTLVELMVSISILAIVTLIIGNGFRLGLDAWDKGENETDYTQRLRVLTGMMNQQMKSAYPYTMKLDDDKVVIFKGEEDSVLFVTTLADASGGGFKWIRYSFRNNTLYYKEGILPDKEFEDKLKGDEEIIDSEMGEMKLSYFSIKDEEWKESWDYGKTIPGAVKVTISYFPPFTVNIPMGKTDEKDDKNVS